MAETLDETTRTVLAALLTLVDTEPATRPTSARLAELTGLESDVVVETLRRAEGEYVRLSPPDAAPEALTVAEVHASALEALRPLAYAAALADSLLAALAEAADDESDPEKKRRLHTAATGIRRVGRSHFSKVTATAVSAVPSSLDGR
jgi:hypothetical protein